MKAPGSMFRSLENRKDQISGVMTPWVYMGMLFASFCWHVEDLYMLSFNYMHKGDPKTWYFIPGEYKDKFDTLIKKKFQNLFLKKPTLLQSITLMLNPVDIINEGVIFFN